MTAALPKRATQAPRLKALTTATSAAAIKRDFSLGCRDVHRDLEHVKSGSMARDGCTKIKKNQSLRRDPIMLCCDQCKWYCVACCWNSERLTRMNRKKTADTNTPKRSHIGTPARPYRHGHTRTDAATGPLPRSHTRTRPRAHTRTLRKTNSALKKASIRNLWTHCFT